MNASIASRAGMSRWFVGSSSSSRFDAWMPEQRQLEPRPLPARQQPDLLERVVAPEQEPRQVAARLAGRDRGRLEQRIEHGRPRDARRCGAGPGIRSGPRSRTSPRHRAAAGRPRSSAAASSCPRRSARRCRSARHAARRGTGRVATCVGFGRRRRRRRPRRHVPADSRPRGPRPGRRSRRCATVRPRRAAPPSGWPSSGSTSGRRVGRPRGVRAVPRARASC